jgi:lipoyl(octanoyl) transferase
MGDTGGQLELIVREHSGVVDYTTAWQRMVEFTRTRTADQADELWLLEHSPVFTTGIRETDDVIHDPGGINVVNTDRGGLVTYHGPGQLILYVLLNLRRLGTGIRSLVTVLEDVAIDVLAQNCIEGERKDNAPGVYVDGCKIASLGLRVQRGYTYHGLSLNIDMDLSPFDRIVPCGLHGIEMTDMNSLGVNINTGVVGRQLAARLARELGYNAQFVKVEDNSD